MTPVNRRPKEQWLIRGLFAAIEMYVMADNYLADRLRLSPRRAAPIIARDFAFDPIMASHLVPVQVTAPLA